MGEERKVYEVLVGNPKGKRPLGRQDIDKRMGREWILGRLAGGCGLDGMGLAQDRDWWQAVVSVDEPSVFCTLE
jgi:hypothetical protein